MQYVCPAGCEADEGSVILVIITVVVIIIIIIIVRSKTHEWSWLPVLDASTFHI